MNLSSFTQKIKADRIDKNHCLYQYLLEKLSADNFATEGYLRATRLFIGYARFGMRQYIQQPSLSKREKMKWLKGVTKLPVWQEIASLYPYWNLPFKYALHFYLLHKRFYRLLYFYSKLK